MKNYKIAASTFFNDNWTASQIHWSGHNFTLTGQYSWLYFKFTQGSVSPKSISNDRIYNEEIVLDIKLYAKTEILLADMYDKLREMLSENRIDDLVVHSIDVDDESILKTTSGDYNYLDLSIVLKH